MSKMANLEKNLYDDFGNNEPIIIKEIDSENRYDIDKDSFRKCLSRLHEEDKIERFDNGIYYFATLNQYFNEKSKLSENKVIEKKYIRDDNVVYGYITGYSFVNYLGLTTQVPQVIEIVTGKISKSMTENFSTSYKLKKTRVNITKDNYKFLQVLDLLTDYMPLIEVDIRVVKDKVFNYLKGIKLTDTEIKKILIAYPAKTSKSIFTAGFDEIVYSLKKENDNVSISE